MLLPNTAKFKNNLLAFLKVLAQRSEIVRKVPRALRD